VKPLSSIEFSANADFVPCPFLFARRFEFSSQEIYIESLVGERPREPVFIGVSTVNICG